MSAATIVTPAIRDAVIASLRAGHSRLRAACDAGISVYLVNKIAAESSVGKNGRQMLSETKRKTIARLLRGGATMHEISRQVGCSQRTVVRVRGELETVT